MSGEGPRRPGFPWEPLPCFRDSWSKTQPGFGSLEEDNGLVANGEQWLMLVVICCHIFLLLDFGPIVVDAG